MISGAGFSKAAGRDPNIDIYFAMNTGFSFYITADQTDLIDYYTNSMLISSQSNDCLTKMETYGDFSSIAVFSRSDLFRIQYSSDS